ncbi:hypothetical protein B9T31_14140 [Acinetobacter sp. ANC 4558]|uniref:hypothetical protein n=1 Tax=Acinetobacter sp. ANC 4558 TaxID=1977876 RepID=UPI000A34DA24|nr:hypothetical protein [Acinetobacter sp. ANC 4558]OTG83226.1 hypothetical protein B9T31_14140 [Acinetobacter sp. ANC 4558]
MNMTKVSMAITGLLAIGALTACQSTPNTKDLNDSKKMHNSSHNRDTSSDHRREMKTMHAEQRNEMRQRKNICEGKLAGSTAQIKMKDQQIDGTCTLVFQPNDKEYKQMRGKNRPMQDEHSSIYNKMKNSGMRMHHNEPLTDARRAELTQQFDQHLAQRQAQQKAVSQACQGRNVGTAIQIKLGEQVINGQCNVRFIPNQPMMPIQKS